jgi:hypothetical protein
MSIEATRPVFMIVMGLSLALVAWRLVRGSTGWAARMIFGGAVLLAFGYAVLVPLYDSGVIDKFHPGHDSHRVSSATLAWHVVKLFTMNAGWLMLGLGLAIHARLFGPVPALARTATESTPKPEQASA